MEKLLLKKMVSELKRGKKVIRRISSNHPERKMILVFPDNELGVVDICLKYISKIFNLYESIIAITTDTTIRDKLEGIDNCEIVLLDDKDMAAIIRYAQVFERNTLRIISFVCPEHLDALDLIGNGGITRESYLYRALLGIYAGEQDYEQKKV